MQSTAAQHPLHLTGLSPVETGPQNQIGLEPTLLTSPNRPAGELYR